MLLTIPNSPVWSRAFSARLLRLPPRRMCYRGVPSWRKHTVLDDNLSNLAENALDHNGDFGMASSKRILSFRLFCFDCKHILQVARKKLYHESKWASLFCPTCNRSSTAKKWLCGCMQPWANCVHHATIGFACRTYKREQPETSVAPRCIQPPRGRTYVVPLKVPMLVTPKQRNIAVHQIVNSIDVP